MKSNSNLAVNMVLTLFVTTLFSFVSCTKEDLTTGGYTTASDTQFSNEAAALPDTLIVSHHSTTPINAVPLPPIVKGQTIIPVSDNNTASVKATRLPNKGAGESIVPVNDNSTSPIKATRLPNKAASESIVPVSDNSTSAVKATRLPNNATSENILPVSDQRGTPISGTHLILEDANGIVVNPNPTTGPITVQFTEPSAENYTIQILSMNKTPLMSTNGVCVAGQNSVRLNLTSLGKGNYLLSFHSADQNQVVEVSVQYP